MKIKKIEIENVGNITKASYELNNINIWSAENGKGKTNTLNALSYLLAKRIMSDSNVGENDFYQLIPNDDNTKVCSVVITTESGTKLGFKHYNKFTKKRGSSETVFDGRVTDWYYNDVKCKNLNEFNSELYTTFNLNRLNEVKVNDSKFNPLALLTDVFYAFNKLDYKVLRELVIHFTGDITFADLVANNSEYKRLEEDNIKYNGRIDLARKNYKSMVLDLQKQVDVAQGIIDSFNVGTFDEEELKELEERRNTLVASKASETKNEEDYIKSLKIEIIKLDAELAGLKANETIINTAKLKEFDDSINDLKNQIRTSESNVNKINNDLKVLQERGKSNKSLNELYKKSLEDKEKQLGELLEDKPQADTCPNCGYELVNSEGYQSKLDKWSRKVETIKAEIRTANDKRLTNIDETKEVLNKIQIANDELIKANAELGDLKAKLSDLEQERINYQESIKVSCNSEIVALNETLKNKREELINANNDLEVLKEEIARKYDEDIKAVCLLIEDTLARKINLENKDKNEKIKSELITKLNEVESMFSLCDRYIKTRIKAISDKTKLTFGIEFKMLEEQVNGGLSEVCYPVVDGKAYSQLNRGLKELTGARFIKAIESLLGIKEFPILIDNAESLSNKTIKQLEIFGNQLFLTRVSDSEEIKFESR